MSASASAATPAPVVPTAAADVKSVTATAATTYKRAFLPKLGEPLQLITEQIPKPKAGSAVVRVIAVEVGARNQGLFGGKAPYKPPAPMTPGTTCVAVVDAVAEDVVGITVGSHVLVNYYLNERGVILLVGAFGLTPTADGAKQSEMWKNGSWGQYAVLPAQCLVPVAADVVKSVGAANLLKFIPLSIAHGALVVRGGFEAGHTVLVTGATGVHGIATVLIALAAGAEKVYVTGRTADTLKKLTALSSRVKPVVIPDEKAVESAFAPLKGQIDVYVDFLPYVQSQTVVLAGIMAMKRGGNAVIAGGVQATLQLPYGQLLTNEWGVKGSLMYPKETLTKVLKLISSGSIDFSVFTHSEHVGVEKILELFNGAPLEANAFKTHIVYPNGKP